MKDVEKVATKCILDEVSGQFENIYHQNFTDVLCKLKESNVEKRKSPYEKEKYARKIRSEVVNCFWRQTSSSGITAGLGSESDSRTKNLGSFRGSFRYFSLA